MFLFKGHEIDFVNSGARLISGLTRGYRLDVRELSESPMFAWPFIPFIRRHFMSRVCTLEIARNLLPFWHQKHLV